ncbi:hypothetical protein [Chamaesiphon sp.]|uniref:hypothetical protein n=1 Tax=Chamaesiphon sp. TaxID=2814140 RepID=UPI0035944C17
MAAAFGNTKYSEFDGGDSILVGTSLLSATNQAITRYGKALVSYNAANAALPLPLLDTLNDPEASLRTNTFTLLATKSYNVATSKFESMFATYVEPYANWVVPTTGNLAGCPSLAEAVHLLVHACKLAYDLLQPNIFLADPSGLVSITDNSDGGIEHSLQYLMIENLDPITGETTYKINDLLTIVDEQQGV